MGFQSWFYNNYKYLNYPLSFYLISRKPTRILKGFIELSKIFLFKTKLMNYNVNERIIERPFALNHLPNVKSKILDIGCADSILPLEMASLGHTVTGLDIKKYPFEHPNFTLQRGDITKLSFQDKSYDVVTCISTIEHMGLEYALGEKPGKEDNRKDKECLKIIYKILKSDGRLILTTPFGKSQVRSEGRVYGQEDIQDLFKEFVIEEQKFYVKEGKHWIRKEPNELNKEAVTLIVATKRPNIKVPALDNKYY
ncbi:MAG: class I SAM-dependent methyltransferase [Nanoarchaeota archaeon]